MNGAVSCEGGERKGINTELWYACAGPLVSLPPAGSLVVYFPQGHSEQVAASMQTNADARIPNYPNLPSKLICLLHNVTLHADPETDEVYARMTLQPVNVKNKDTLQASDFAPSSNRPQTEFFCKTLTASDTSTHGGFSVPRRAAEKIFPPLDFSMQPPVQELRAKDLHDNVWTFRHIYRGQPKRHLLTTGWSLFVSGKRLVAGDSVLFIRVKEPIVFRDEKSQLLLGIRRANKQVNNISSSVLSSDSMHIGVLAAAAHAAANNSPFTLFYNPRASPSEFVIPLSKYNKAIYGNHISLGMRFRMTFETEESGTRRYMGTITGVSELDPVRWKYSQWRNLQVGWDESAAGEKRNRVSIWEIEPVVAPFFVCPPPFFRPKLSRQIGDEPADSENLLKRSRPWFGDQISINDSQSPNVAVPGMSLAQWMNMQNQLLANTNMQPDYLSSIPGTTLQNLRPANIPNQSSFQAQILQQNCMQFNAQNRIQQTNQMTPTSNMSVLSNQLGNAAAPQQLPCDALQQKHRVNQIYPFNQTHSSLGQTQLLVPTQVQQQQPLIQISQPPQSSLLQSQSQFLLQQNPQKLHQQQWHDQIPIQLCHQTNHPQVFEQELQLQQCQKLQQQQQSLPPQPILQNSQPTQEQHHLVKVSHCSPNSYSFPLQNTGSQQAANNTSVAMCLSHSLHKQTQKNPQQQLVEEVSEPTQEQKHLVNVSQCSSNSYSFPLQNTGSQQAANNTSVAIHPSHSLHNQTQKKPQQNVLEEELPRMSHPPVILHPSPQSSLPKARVTQLEMFDDIPSCSRSPSTNASVLSQTIQNRSCPGPLATDEMPRPAVTPSPGILEVPIAIPNACKELQKNESKEKTPPVTSKMQNVGVVDPQVFLGSAPHMDFLDSSSSATSSCLPQADGQLRENLPSPNQSSIFFRISASDGKIQAADPGSDDIFGVNNGCTLDILPQTDCFISKDVSPVNDCLNKLSSGNMLENYNSKEAQKDLPKSYASQSFGVLDVAFSSIDSTINDCSFSNRSSRAQPQQKMRTYTKVYKRGAVGRSIDITRYSGYGELKEDLARMFSLGRELEDLQKIGWKLVYVDQENDVLLVGDDPWEEFVSCVRCIRILSPQEVQQMSLDGDLDNNILPNQTCGSSEGGNMWRDQNPVNPSSLSYDRFG